MAGTHGMFCHAQSNHGVPNARNGESLDEQLVERVGSVCRTRIATVTRL